MAVGLAVAVRNTRLNAIRDAIDAGSGAGTLKIYNGTKPATGASIGGLGYTLLATLTFSDPSAPGAAAGTVTYSTITQDLVADATDTATWARILDSAANVVMDIDVAMTAGSNKIVLNTTSIVAGGPVSVTSFILTEGNA